MKNKFILLTIMLISLLLIGCNNKSNELDNILEKNNYIIVDVRTSLEYNSGHVVGAINIPYDEIDENVDLDKSKTILVYCKSGTRSGIAYDSLKSFGYNVYNLGAYDSIKLDKE